jgi:uncharacterized protein (TIGR02246 family)
MSIPDTMQETQDHIRDLVTQINAAWTAGRPDDLASYLREDVVFVQPGFQVRTVGRDACVASYKEFLAQASVHTYEESDVTVDVYSNTAVLTYRFAITYSMEETRYADTGYDIFVFVREDGAWRAAWRTLAPDTPA